MNLEVSKSLCLQDEPISIRVQGLPAGSLATIQLQVYDEAQELWQSEATFRVPEHGQVDLDTLAPVGGDYEEVDGMGLFTCMRPIHAQVDHFSMPSRGLTYAISLILEGQRIETRPLHRMLQLPDTKTISLREEGIVATLFLPTSDAPLPLIISLGGSNGGLGQQRAQMLSCHGYATLALAYFGCEELPKYLERIEIEYFEKVLNYLEKHYGDRLDLHRIGLYGVSRGAELSLLLGSLWPERFCAVAAVVPSSVVYGSMKENDQPAWVYHGKEILPAAPLPRPSQAAQSPLATTALFLEGAKDQPQFEQAAICVEHIGAPLLLVSGGNDQMWPSTFFANRIIQRMQQHGKADHVEHLDYPEAGHRFTVAYFPQIHTSLFHPAAQCLLETGGTTQANMRASCLAWWACCDFFSKHL